MMMVAFQRNIPIRHKVDIFVAGGGPAGVSATVAAARQGRSVFLAERHTCLGGMGTAGLVPVFMQFSDGVNMLAAGIGEEILTKLRQAGGTGPDNQFAIRAEVLKRVYDDLLIDAGVNFTFETQLIDIEKKSDRVCLAILAAKSGMFAVEARVFIDCTGDGDLAVWAGAPFEKGDEESNLMPGTLCSLWADIDWDTVKKGGRIRDDSRLEEAFKDNVFTHEDRHLPGMWRVGKNIGGGNIGHTFGVDATDERSVTQALIWARKSLLEYEHYYKKYLKGFENMELVSTGSLLGIRESRRIMGDYVLNLEDFKKRAVFDDEIGRYAYPVDIHASKPDAVNYKKFEEEFKTLRYNKGESYGIPYRILVPQKLSNVLTAGRCVSSDRYIQGSIRVMPGCFITGQAAGVAASIAIEKNTDTRGFSVAELQKRLKEIGAYLPNC
ncbi:FAD-dependent oxidoreductase [Candidatus Poribacteria bacterium]|nr:FAD-dependent oxidoreductase [Candidatus Poribacteria bacterium]